MNCQVLLINERAAQVIQPAIGEWQKLGYTGLVLIVDFESPPLSGDVDVFGRRNSIRLSSCFAGIEIRIFRADHFAVRRPDMARIHWRA